MKRGFTFAIRSLVYLPPLTLLASCGEDSIRGPMATHEGFVSDAGWSDEFQLPGTDSPVQRMGVFNGELIIFGNSISQAGGRAVEKIAAWNGTSWRPFAPPPMEEVDYQILVWNNKLVAASPSELKLWDGSTWHSLERAFPLRSSAALLSYQGDLYMGGPSAHGVYCWEGESWKPLGIGLRKSTEEDPDVWALAEFQGDLIAAGSFQLAGGKTVRNIARWDGEEWYPLGDGPEGVKQIIVHDDRLIVEGGAHIFAWTDNQWQELRWQGSRIYPAFINTMCVYEGQLYVGGKDQGGSGILVRWEEVNATWTLVAEESSSGVEDLIVYDGGLVVGGNFDDFGYPMNYVVDARNIVSWKTGRFWPLGNGIDKEGSSSVWSLLEQDGRLLVGGHFRSAGGVYETGLAVWDGATWVSSGYMGYVRGLALTNSHVFAGGTSYSGTSATIRMWAGDYWSELGAGVTYGSDVLALSTHEAGIYLGGRFLQLGGTVPAFNVGQWAGGWSGVGEGLMSSNVVEGGVFSLLMHENTLFAGGLFDSDGSEAVANVGWWDGQQWSQVGLGLDGPVYALHEHQGQVVAGGRFRSSGGAKASRVAVWNGESWGGLGDGLEGTVYALETFGQYLVVGGDSLASDQLGPTSLAVWDGQSWSTWGTEVDGAVRALEVVNGDLFVGGSFRQIGRRVSYRLARWPGAEALVIIK